MKTTIVIGLLLILAFGVFLKELAKSQRYVEVMHAKNSLVSTYADVQQGNALTNSWNRHTHPYTNRYVLDGTAYQCVMAIDSWDYQGPSNLLMLTADKKFLYIDGRGVRVVTNRPPGY
jgi:hypothetical protein